MEGGKGKKKTNKKAKVQGKTDCIIYIHKAAHGPATDLSLNTPSGWNCADLTKHCSKVTRQENKRKKTKARHEGRAGRGRRPRRLKKPKGGTAATRQEEAAAKAARFRKVVK